jgi:hypothetical protein
MGREAHLGRGHPSTALLIGSTGIVAPLRGMSAVQLDFGLLTVSRVLDEIKWLSRVESVQVRTVTDNPFSQVASKSLFITSPLRVLNITKEKTPNPKIRRDVLEACDHHVDIFWDTEEAQARFGTISLNKCDFAVWQYKTYPPPRHRQSNRDVFIMPIRMIYYDYYKHDYEAPMLQGLSPVAQHRRARNIPTGRPIDRF